MIAHVPKLAEAVSAVTANAQLVVVPVGSLEQHGPHLPLDTDTVIAQAVAEHAARELDDVWVAPALGYGSSGEHQSFTGTCSVGTPALQSTVIELVRSISTWAPRIAFVNGHGGNVAALSSAVKQLTAEGHRVSWHACATEDVDLHAGFTETSLMLHLKPWAVRMHRAEPGNTAPLGEILAAMRDGGVAAVSANGVLGDPTGANAGEGERALRLMASQVLTALRLESAGVESR